jgi:hypothetical protein
MRESREQRIAYWAYVAFVLVFALTCRSVIFGLPDEENDEMIFRALVESLSTGLGYTLRGHSLLSTNFAEIARTYDSPVFIHPPAGIFYFYAITKVFGLTRWALRFAQPLAFAVYYLAGLKALDFYMPDLERGARFLAAPLFAFTPVYAHTNLKVWLENPRLAFFMVHFFCLAFYLRAPSRAKAILAVLTSLAPVLTRVDSLAAYPFLYAFADSIFPRHRRFFWGLLLLNALAVVSWLLYSSALQYGPGRPPAELLEHNKFLRFFVVEFSSWNFAAHFFKLTASLLPAVVALLGLSALGMISGSARPRWTLALWALSQVALYAALGFFGYMKLQRFLILALPASVFLAVITASDLIRARKSLAVLALAAFLALGVFIEVGEGIYVLFTNGTEASLRPPF